MPRPDSRRSLRQAGYPQLLHHARGHDQVEALLGFARNLRYSGSPKDAVRVLKDADETVTDRNDVLLERAKAQLAASMINDVRETLDRLLVQDPDNWQVHATLGITLDRLGQFEEAVARYRAALVRSPNNSAVHNNIALSLAQVGRLDEAISALEIVVESERSTAQTRQNLALLYALQGDLERAEKLAREDLPPALVKDRMETFLGLRQAPAAPPSSEKDERARAPAEGTPRQADAVGTSRPVALKAYVALRNADVRRDPSIRSRAFAVLQKDETVRVIETAKNRRWYRVRLDDGREGYIYSSLIAERK